MMTCVEEPHEFESAGSELRSSGGGIDRAGETVPYFGGGDGLGVPLDCGWWSDECQPYTSIRTVTHKVGWFAINLDFFSNFARSIWLNRNPE